MATRIVLNSTGTADVMQLEHLQAQALGNRRILLGTITWVSVGCEAFLNGN